MVLIYTDGASNGRFGYFKKDEKPKFFQEDGLTTNEAEYKAIIKALESCDQFEKVYIMSDSLLAVNQITGKWRTKEQRLRELKQIVWTFAKMKQLDVEYHNISRRYNDMVKAMRRKYGRPNKSGQQRARQIIQNTRQTKGQLHKRSTPSRRPSVQKHSIRKKNSSRPSTVSPVGTPTETTAPNVG